MELPRARYLVITWGIPESFGGMTEALLHRSRVFVQRGGVTVDILTLDRRAPGERSYAEVAAGLRAEGRLVDGMRLLNLWEWLAEHPDSPLHERVVDGRGSGKLYRSWVDRIRGGAPAIVMVDSKTAANHFLAYRKPDVVTVHVVHSSHLVGVERPVAPLRETRKRVFENLSSYDLVTVLTERQRGDVEALLGPQPNVIVVPNGLDVAGGGGLAAGRDPGRGIVLASLTPRKRVTHAVDAIANARASGAGTARLDIYGDGEERPLVEDAVSRAGAQEFVALHGYQREARRQFASASFLLLTSTSEGFPLVLIEAMAVGCIPIAYDVSYGPADIIRDGVNGMLVPAGDEAALAEAIVRFLALPEEQRERMRAEAVTTAARFTDEAVLRRWSDALTSAARARRSRPIARNGARVVRRLKRIVGRLRATPAQR